MSEVGRYGKWIDITEAAVEVEMLAEATALKACGAKWAGNLFSSGSAWE